MVDSVALGCTLDRILCDSAFLAQLSCQETGMAHVQLSLNQTLAAFMPIVRRKAPA
jgi:hypothetical protein